MYLKSPQEQLESSREIYTFYFDIPIPNGKMMHKESSQKIIAVYIS